MCVCIYTRILIAAILSTIYTNYTEKTKEQQKVNNK